MCYKIRPAIGDIWFIIDPAGAIIGSCSSRSVALDIIALVGGRVGEPCRQQPEAPRPAEVPEARDDSPKVAAPTPAVRVRPEPFRPGARGTNMFGWYAPRRRSPLWSFLRRCYRYVRRSG